MIRAVVFDVGRVLVQWDLRHLFAKLIDDPEELEWFVTHVVTPEWHFQHDAGRPLAEMLPELKAETRFADVLIIGSEVFYENLGGKLNEYLQDILHRSECPVVVVPEKYDFPKTNILCYDGSESSVYAIKQFAYLFPELTKHPTLLVYVHEDGKNEFPQQVNIEEKLKTASDSSYQTGVIIGSFIPFVLLIIVAYWMYYLAKKRDKNG